MSEITFFLGLYEINMSNTNASDKFFTKIYVSSRVAWMIIMGSHIYLFIFFNYIEFFIFIIPIS